MCLFGGLASYTVERIGIGRAGLSLLFYPG